MNDFLVFPRESDDLFVHIPATLNRNYLEETLSRYLREPIRVLEIKSERIADEPKLANIRKELDELNRRWRQSPFFGVKDIDSYRNELKKVNEQLWEIEDYLRVKEDEGSFDEQFIELARSQYRNSDRRAEIKRLLDEQFQSDFVEEKSYPAYSSL